MKIDSIDIRSFDAKQLTVDFEPPQTGVTVEMFDGALIPSESETYTPLSGLTVTVLFRGKDRDNENTVHSRVQIHGVLVQRRSEFELAGSV